jgi:hypothetical protein
MRRELPKSPSFQTPLAVRNTFSLLMSRCTMPCRHQNTAPPQLTAHAASHHLLAVQPPACNLPSHKNAGTGSKHL